MADTQVVKSSYEIYDPSLEEWKKYSFDTLAESVQLRNGTDVETEIMNMKHRLDPIKGITASINVTEEGFAADATAIKKLYDAMKDVDIKLKYNTTAGAPMWSEDGTDWYFFKHWHIGSAGVPDKNLKDNDQTFTKATGCFTKMTKVYHTHSKANGCYTTVYRDCMVLSPHWDPGEAAQGAVVWRCTVCGKYSGDTGTSTSPTDPCYHNVDVFNCTKTEGVTVDKTYYACNCGKSAGSYRTNK